MSATSLLQGAIAKLAEPQTNEGCKEIQSRLEPARLAGPSHVESWWQAVEHVALTRAQAGDRCIGITCVDGNDGTSTFARMLAEVFCQSGRSTLLVDLSTDVAELPTFWSPQDRDVSSFVALDKEPAVLVGRPQAANRLHFHDASRMRLMFTETFASYASIVVDLASLAHLPSNGINPLPTAAACDAVILLGSRGRMTHARLQDAVDLARSAKVNVAGVIFNDREYVQPAAEIARAARSAFRFVPPISRWAQEKIRHSSLFN